MDTKNHIKTKYYSDTKITDDYDYKRFERGGGIFVAEEEIRVLHILLDRAELSSESVLLDCPTGTGRFLPELERISKNIIAADISPAMLEIAKKYSAQQYIEASADKLPLENASVDFWLMSRFCFHFDSLDVFFEECVRVIKPGGYLAFDVFNFSPRSLLPEFLLGGRTFNHRLNRIRKLCVKHGFEIVLRENNFFIPTYISGFLPNIFVKAVEKLTHVILRFAKTKSYYLLRRK